MKEKAVRFIAALEAKYLKNLYDSFFNFGVKHGFVRPYELSLIERLRKVYYGGMAASVILLIRDLCNGKCYDRATMLSMGMDKFVLIWGSIRDLRMKEDLKLSKTPILEETDHIWIESGGWVYDTSSCFKLRKWFYYLLEGPIIRRKRNQDWCRRQKEYKEMCSGDIEKDKYCMPLIIPLIEPQIPGSTYEEWAANELELFKQAIGYDQICAEVHADMKAKGFC